MVRLTAMALVLVGAFCPAVAAGAYDRVASVGESPISAETGPAGDHGMLVDLLRALDRVTHSSTRIVLRPFARSFVETAAGHADFHIPFIQNDGSPAPEGLVYVTEVDFGEVQFVIYSRKDLPLNAETVVHAKAVETESGHVSFFSFPVTETHCVPCSLNKILLGRAGTKPVTRTGSPECPDDWTSPMAATLCPLRKGSKAFSSEVETGSR